MGMAGYLVSTLVLFLAAVAFLAGELLVPSHGILAAISAACAIAGAALAYFVTPVLGILASVLVIISAPVAFYWIVKLYPQTPVGKRVMLQKPEAAALQAFGDRASALQSLVGKQGLALSLLRPAGLCEIDGRRIDSVAESTIIESGARVEVVRVVGMKVIVRAL